MALYHADAFDGGGQVAFVEAFQHAFHAFLIAKRLSGRARNALCPPYRTATPRLFPRQMPMTIAKGQAAKWRVARTIHQTEGKRVKPSRPSTFHLAKSMSKGQGFEKSTPNLS